MNLLFDLDGTLTDPRQGILACFKYSLRRLQLEAPPDLELERFIGPPLRESFAALVGRDDGECVEQAIAYYRERFATVGIFENHVYPEWSRLCPGFAIGERFIRRDVETDRVCRTHRRTLRA